MKMQLKKVSKTVAGILSLASLTPVAAFAQEGVPVPLVTSVTTYGGVVGIINTAANWLFGILLVVTVIFLIYAAFLFLTSGGDEEKVKKARKYVIYAVIAIGIGILAKGIIALVGTFLGYNVPTQ